MQTEKIDELAKAWGNEAFAADRRFIDRMMEEIIRLPFAATVIECGSGLTTLIGTRLRNDIYYIALENDQKMIDKIAAINYSAASHVECCAITDFGQYYSWYDLPPETTSCLTNVDLIICDGPVGTTKGGRFGVMPQLWEYFDENSRLLLDDANRSAERYILDLWKKSYPIEYEIRLFSDSRGYAIVTLR